MLRCVNWCSLIAGTPQVLLRNVDRLAATQREILLRKRQGHQREEDILELNIAQTKDEFEAQKESGEYLVISGGHDTSLIFF